MPVPPDPSAEALTDKASPCFPVLVVDDEPDDVFFITRRIHKSGVRNPIMTFSDGDEAVAHLARVRENRRFAAPACAIFCDIKMPRLNGFDVLRRVRQWPEYAPIRFVMLSGSNESIDRERAAELGASRYLVKFPPEHTFAEIITEANAAIANANLGRWQRADLGD